MAAQPANRDAGHSPAAFGTRLHTTIDTIKNQRVNCRILAISKLRQLMLDPHFCKSRLSRNDVAKRHSIVESSDFNRKLASSCVFEIDRGVVIEIANGFGLAYRNGVTLVGVTRMYPDLAHARPQQILSFKLEAKRGFIHKPLAVEVDGVVHAFTGWIARRTDRRI